jgi:hypothetical protein
MSFVYDLSFGTRIRDHFVSSSADDAWVESFCAWVLEAVVNHETENLAAAEVEISSIFVSSTDGEEAEDLNLAEAEVEAPEDAVCEPDSTSDDVPIVEFVDHESTIE